MKIKSVLLVCVIFVSFGFSLHARVMERLNRGVVAVRTGTNSVYVGWRMLGTDPNDIGFNVYRGGVKVNATPITTSTNYTDATTANSTYTVRPVIGGVEQADSEPASVWTNQYKTINLNRPAGGTTPDAVVYDYSPNDCSVGDVDGDGEYEIIVKWDPSNSKDNSQSGYTGNVYLDCYKLSGAFMWRIDLGINIRAGAHYTQFMVYDLNSDGKSEIACKTAPGTRDATGAYLHTGPAASDTDTADYRNTSGYILSGPEYLTVFNGQTGAEITTVNYVPARGTVSSWGDSYGNRVDRFLACIAYLDGQKPSLVMCRGYYTRAVLAAWDFDGTSLTQRWVFDSNTSGNSAYAGEGNHNLSVGDVDNDGRDEIIYGSCAIDDNGTGLYATGLGHGDAGHLSNMDPDRAGLEWFQPHEEYPQAAGAEYRDPRTGALLWGYPNTSDTGRGLAANIDGNYRGFEMWASNTDGVYNVNGTRISTTKPSINFRVYWDGDLLDELLDGTKLDEWTGSGVSRLYTFYNFNSAQEINGTKANPNLSADILGDWREEVIYRNSGNTQLMIFTTVTNTNYRFHTLMHDFQYRLSVAWQNVAYNQPPHLSFYLQDGWAAQPVKAITYPGEPAGTPTRTSTVTPTFTRTPTQTPLPVNYKEIQLEYPCSMDGIFENTNTGFTGDGYANLNNAAGSALTFSLNSSAAQSVSLSFVYANGSVNNRNMSIAVNGSVQVSNIDFLNTGGWTVWSTSSASVNLAPGYNTITLTSLMAEGAPNLDKVFFVSSSINNGGCSAGTATYTPTSPVLPTATRTPTRTATRTATPTSLALATATFTATAGGTTVPSYDGFAAYNGTTGGAGGETVYVNNLADFMNAVRDADSTPRTVYITAAELNSGDDKGMQVRLGSNKTIIGCGTGSGTFMNGVLLGINNKSNIIIRNLKFTMISITNTTDPAVYDPDGDEGRPQIIVNGGDCISIQGTSSNVWIDHCEFYQQDPAVQTNQDLYDGLVDIKNNSQFITLSWNYFHDHHKCHLIGSSDTDNYDRKVTFHHNYYKNIKERMPSYRFGTGHIYSNYYLDVLSSAVNSRMEACLRVENNYFENSDDPILTANSTLPGYWDLRNSSGGADNSNIYQNCTGNRPTTSNCTFNPPYVHLSYMTAASQVKAEVMAGAGVGKVNLCGGATATSTSISTLLPSATSTSTSSVLPTATRTMTSSVLPTATLTFTLTPLPVNYKELQGEAMCSYDGAFEDLHAGYTGTGYANFDNTPGSSGVFFVNASSAQALNITFRYANGSVNERDMSISVNGTAQVSAIAFAPTGAWASWTEVSVTVNLYSGRNEIVITAQTAEGGPNLDRIYFASSSVSFDACVPSPTNTPVLTATMTETPEATATRTATAANTGTIAPSPSYTATTTVTAGNTVTNTPTLYALTPSFTPTRTNTIVVTPSNTPQGTITNSPTNTASATASLALTATTTADAGSSGTPTVTMTSSPLSSATATATLTPYPASPTFTATPTLTAVPSNTSTATLSRTATPTSTSSVLPTSTITVSPTRTPTPTRTIVPATFTVTPTYTITPVPDGTVLKITKTDSYPNPVKVTSGQGMTVEFYATKRCVKASFVMYTRAFRKILVAEKQGPLSAGMNTITIDNSGILNLSPGVYYGQITATGEDGKEIRGKAVTIIIIR